MDRWLDCDRATVKRRYDRLARFIPVFDRLLFCPPGCATARSIICACGTVDAALRVAVE